MLFESLKLIDPILKALKDEGYNEPTPIQAQTIPLVLERRDVLGVAQTGTGKTAAFSLPILQIISQIKGADKFRMVRALIVTPTRELAMQISDNIRAYGKYTGLKSAVIFGGVGQNPQVLALQRGVDIVVATPGRLLDLINQGHLSLKDIEVFVLDEADRMLDMGFVHDVKKLIAKLPRKRQSLFFSATMPPAITELADKILTKPVRVEVTPVSSTVEKITQRVFFVDKENKKNLLMDILSDRKIERVLVFTRTKHGADRVAKELVRQDVTALAIHGNKSHNNRQNALNSFKAKSTRVLVATDIAARGIDIDELTHVINYELPNEPESYVHRIGRTGRAGASGVALSFCDNEERAYLRDIQKVIAKQIPVDEEHMYQLEAPDPSKPLQEPSRGGRRPSRGGGQRQGDRNGGARQGQATGREGAPRDGGNRDAGGWNGASRNHGQRSGVGRNQAARSYGERQSAGNSDYRR